MLRSGSRSLFDRAKTGPAKAGHHVRFEVRLKPALDVPGTVIPKDQYDIVMNVLDAFHPVGVEVRTDRIRAHVREIEQETERLHKEVLDGELGEKALNHRMAEADAMRKKIALY